MPTLEVRSASDLLRTFKATLLKAYGGGRLKNPLQQIHRFVREVEPPPKVAASVKAPTRAIQGGIKDFKRLPTSAQLIRADNAWFHFTLTVSESPGVLELVAYDFEIVFPPGASPGFVRFDLNQPGHATQDRGLRSHMHPGNDALILPAPVLAPDEALELMLTI